MKRYTIPRCAHCESGALAVTLGEPRYGSRQWWYLLASDIDHIAAAYPSGSLRKRLCESAADACRWRARHARRR